MKHLYFVVRTNGSEAAVIKSYVAKTFIFVFRTGSICFVLFYYFKPSLGHVSPM